VWGQLRAGGPHLAAEHFNWLVMSIPLNRVMLCDDAGRPGPADVDRYAGAGTRTFLAAYRAN
jgi:TetR/AcrR family transcriptional regulator, mexJK operon transcriptional repressor